MHLRQYKREDKSMSEFHQTNNNTQEPGIDPEIEPGPQVGGAENQVTNLNVLPGDIPNYSREEETAAELTAMDHNDRITTKKEDKTGTQSNVVGWAGLALSILSFFMMPLVFGGAGIIVGFIARNRDSEWLGNIAIAGGVISIAISLFIRPFV